MAIPWHTQSAEDVLRHWSSSETGLAATEAAERLKTHGLNELTERRGKGPFAMLLGAVHRDHGADPDRRRSHLGLPRKGHRNRGHSRHRGALRESSASSRSTAPSAPWRR